MRFVAEKIVFAEYSCLVSSEDLVWSVECGVWSAWCLVRSAWCGVLGAEWLVRSAECGVVGCQLNEIAAKERRDRKIVQ